MRNGLRNIANFGKKMTCVNFKVGIIGGSGLENPEILKNREEKSVTTPFGKPSDVLVTGDIENVPCVILARHGRLHNIMPGNVNYRANIWALKEEGCTHVIASNAVGSLQEEIVPGDFVIIDNFLDRTTNRKQTFYDGECGHPVGVSHLPMEPAFCELTRKTIIEITEQLNIKTHKTGTVVAIEGPRYSSKAESNMYRLCGGHVIGMTSVPELVLAKEAGLCYAAIGLATDYDCWRTTTVNVDEVMKTFASNVDKMTKLLLTLIPKLATIDWGPTLLALKATVKDNVMLPH